MRRRALGKKNYEKRGRLRSRSPYASSVVVVGLGGIGSHLIEPLVRYLAAETSKQKSKGPSELILVDGDRVEESNLGRQRFEQEDLGIKKSEAWAENLKSMFKVDFNIIAIPEYISQRNIKNIIKDCSVVFSCVDNHATRKLLQVHSFTLRNTLLITGGNDWVDGNIMIYRRQEGKELTPPITKYHREIRFPQDRNPAEMSCTELAQSGSPQLIFANLSAATLMLNAFFGEGGGNRSQTNVETYFDIETNRVRPTVRH